MNAEVQASKVRAPIFGIASLTAPLIAIGLWFVFTNPIMGVYMLLVLTAVGVALALVAGRRQEGCRPLSRIGLVLNGLGFLYVFLCLFV
jgi:hypothetical protein